MSSLEWDRCATFALATFGVAITAFIGSWRIQSPGPGVGWQRATLLSVSAVFLVAALVLTWFSVARHPSQLRRRVARENKRAAKRQRAKFAAALPKFEEAFRGWSEFLGSTEVMFTVLALEEDRLSGHERQGPGWEEFVQAASAARTAAEAIWEPWRAEAIVAMTPLVELREPIDFRTASDRMRTLREFLQLDVNRTHFLMDLAADAGIGGQEFVQRLKAAPTPSRPLLPLGPK